MRVFLSVPMKGRTADEIAEDIAAAKKDFPFNGRRTEFIDNFIIGEEGSPLHFLARAIELLDECDAIYMCPGWEEHNGCLVEFAVASFYNIPIYGHSILRYVNIEESVCA